MREAEAPEARASSGVISLERARAEQRQVRATIAACRDHTRSPGGWGHEREWGWRHRHPHNVLPHCRTRSRGSRSRPGRSSGKTSKLIRSAMTCARARRSRPWTATRRTSGARACGAPPPTAGAAGAASAAAARATISSARACSRGELGAQLDHLRVGIERLARVRDLRGEACPAHRIALGELTRDALEHRRPDATLVSHDFHRRLAEVPHEADPRSSP